MLARLHSVTLEGIEGIICEVEGDRPGQTPLYVWESMKAALCAGDVKRALTFIADVSKEDYEEIFRILGPNLQDYVARMGAMTLSLRKAGKVKYEMLHEDNGQTYSFPVFFIKDEYGNWRIYKF